MMHEEKVGAGEEQKTETQEAEASIAQNEEIRKIIVIFKGSTDKVGQCIQLPELLKIRCAFKMLALVVFPVKTL